jgi:DNA-binding SARP family transcriptional activator
MSDIVTFDDNRSANDGRIDRFRLSLLGTWRLSRCGVEARVSANRQRLIALVALVGPQNRAFVAGALWPDSSDAQAQGNLRSTLSRLQLSGLRVVESVGDVLRLVPDVEVDIRELTACAQELVHATDPCPPAPGVVLRLQGGGDLLTGWYDDWVVDQRERLRQLRLHALEIASTVLSENGRYAEALEAALATVDLEPLRESAHRLVAQVHLAEGNQVEAVRQFHRYRFLLRRELGIEPSEHMLGLVRPFIAERGVPRRRPDRQGTAGRWAAAQWRAR